MDIKSLYEQVKFDNNLKLYNFITPTFTYNYINNTTMKEYEVQDWQEMRMDLVFKEMYNLESNEVGVYLNEIDILFYINNIDNPLNIQTGMLLKYPNKISDFNNFRTTDNNSTDNRFNNLEKLVVPNKQTRTDKNRKILQENSYVLPPVVQDVPTTPVKIENGKFRIGGL